MKWQILLFLSEAWQIIFCGYQHNTSVRMHWWPGWAAKWCFTCTSFCRVWRGNKVSTNTSGFSVCCTLSLCHGHQTQTMVMNACCDGWCHGLGLAAVSALRAFLVFPFLWLVFRIPEQRVTHSCQLFSLLSPTWAWSLKDTVPPGVAWCLFAAFKLNVLKHFSPTKRTGTFLWSCVGFN